MSVLLRARQHRFAVAVHIGPILRCGFRSMVPGQSPPLIVTPQDQNLVEFGTVEAFIGSSVKKTQDPKQQKMLIVTSLEAAARATQKRKFRFGQLAKPEYIYTNAAGGRVLKMFEELKTEFDREKIRNRELKTEFGREKIRNRELKTEFDRVKTEFDREKIRNHEWQITMGPVREATIAIRQRLFEKHRKGKGKGTPAGKAAITLGNKVAHEGNIILDSILINQGDITDTSTFSSLYGVAWGSESLQNYQSMYPATTELLFSKNNRFTNSRQNVEHTRDHGCQRD